MYAGCSTPWPFSAVPVAELEAVLADLARRLEEAGIGYMVIGGLANAVWGSPRSTIDIDCTVLLDPARVGGLLETLGPEYLSRTDDPEAFVRRTRVLPLRHRDGVQIDLIFAMLPFEEEAVGRAVEVKVRGFPVRFCSPEDLVLHKIVSDRERDRQDVEDILRRRRSSLDRSYLDPRIEGLANLLARIVQEGSQRAARGAVAGGVLARRGNEGVPAARGATGSRQRRQEWWIAPHSRSSMNGPGWDLTGEPAPPLSLEESHHDAGTA